MLSKWVRSEIERRVAAGGRSIAFVGYVESWDLGADVRENGDRATVGGRSFIEGVCLV